MSERDIDTETIRKPKGAFVQIAGHRMALPIGTILVAILGSLGTAYQVVAADRDAVLARVSALEQCAVDLRNKREVDQTVLLEIRTQLVRIDARVAEVQVTLMRGGR